MSEHQWFYLSPGTNDPVGPIPESELVDLAFRAKLRVATKVASPSVTQNQWVEFQSVPSLHAALSQLVLVRDQERERDASAKRAERDQLKVEKRSARELRNANRKQRLVWPWIAIAVAFIAGFFAGREYLRYEIRSTLVSAMQGMGLDTPGASEPSEAPEPFASQGPIILDDRVRVSVTETSIRRSSGETDPILAIVLRVQNIHDRKVLNMYNDSFSLGSIRLTDDVGNYIREVGFGRDDSFDEIKSRDEILPGNDATHSMAFAVPLPKTEYLTLRIEAQRFGISGDDFLFRLPIGKVGGFVSQ